jgi:hypothetical protein
MLKERLVSALPLLRMIWYGIVLLLTAVVVLGLAQLNLWGACNQDRELGKWRSSWQECMVGEGAVHRLRLYVVAKAPLVRGSRVDSADLSERLGLLPERELDCPRQDGACARTYVPTAQLANGRYPLATIPRGEPLKFEQLSGRPVVPPGTTVVTVSAKSLHAAHLVPGMRLLFVSETAQAEPKTSIPCTGSGLELLAVVSAATADSVGLLVALPTRDCKTRIALSRGTWRPVVVGAAETH